MTLSTGNSYLDSLGKTAAAAATTKAKSSGTIDQAGFLKLLTAQLATQDPTAPTDTTAMTQQMATFSQVAGITEMNSSLKTMSTDLAASRFGDASGWIGRVALVKSDTVAAVSGGAYGGEITLPADAKDVTLSLVDSSGQSVHSESLGAHAAGTMDWSWDGKDASGNAVAGPLRMIASATPASGNTPITPTVQAWTQVLSVQSPTTGSTKLVTGLGTFAPADVQQLS